MAVIGASLLISSTRSDNYKVHNVPITIGIMTKILNVINLQYVWLENSLSVSMIKYARKNSFQNKAKQNLF